IDLTATHVACYLGADGTATAVVSGGSAPYTYLWSNGETTATISGLIAGMYTVTITDERGCEAIDSVEVTEPGHLHVYATATGILCSDDLNGTATAIVGGGVEDYTFVWTQFGEVVSTENPATDLAAGPIVVTVTDANGCTAIGSTEITSPEELVVELGSTNVLCHGESNGSAEATVTGGTADYSYLWSNGATTASITDLIAGTYSVIVTDANGCETEAEVTITEPAMLVLAIERTHISCHGLTDGSATVTVSGGTAPFTYLWNTGATTATVSDLAAGDYTVEVTDANGCMIDIAVKLNEPDAISITIESTNNNCYGDDMGTATATVDGGTPEYTYMWNTGATTESISDLAAGTYTVVVTDENGCEMEASVTITEPEMLTIELGSTNVLCNGDATGTATAYAAGGTAPYTYLWS
ncbi:SprB repeat-containing protein, partial [Crocinitomix catalasitica]|uniref:SprB repeat-containing protein n=1 Tax=Crocinitomix catalasitica TaxID=184607 RepID=UPI00047F7F23